MSNYKTKTTDVYIPPKTNGHVKKWHPKESHFLQLHRDGLFLRHIFTQTSKVVRLQSCGPTVFTLHHGPECVGTPDRGSAAMKPSKLCLLLSHPSAVTPETGRGDGSSPTVTPPRCLRSHQLSSLRFQPFIHYSPPLSSIALSPPPSLPLVPPKQLV